jgi:hypothetical protein
MKSRATIIRRPRDIDKGEFVLRAAEDPKDANIDVFFGLDVQTSLSLTKLRRIHKWVGQYIKYLEALRSARTEEKGR